MPVPIYLNYYIYEMRGDCCVTEAPTSWSVYGSIDGLNWTHIDSRAGVTGWLQGRSKVFNVTSPPRLFDYFMINSTNLGSVAELRYFGQLENDTWPVLNRYPPTRILYANSLVSKMPYGNGYYKVRASSEEGSSIVRAFDACSSSYWHSASSGKFFYSFRLSKSLIYYQVYSGDPPNVYYSGSVSTRLANGTFLSGEWLQLTLPEQIFLNGYSFYSIEGYCGRAPVSFFVVGSNDGISRNLLAAEFNQTTQSSETRSCGTSKVIES